MTRTFRPLLHAAAVALALLATVASSASAQDDAPPEARYRAALMNGLQSHNGALRLLLSGEVARPDHVVQHARAVHELYTMMETSFPDGSGGEGTRALPAIWENWDAFVALLEEGRAAAEVLREAAEAGDEAATAAALREVGQSCRACHTDYRARPGR